VTAHDSAPPTRTLGAIFRPQSPPEDLRAAVQAAEQAGLDEVWLWEDCFLESGIAAASAALAWTDRLVIGIGLLPVPLRNVAVTAMEIATLERLFPGRVRIALGHGVQDWMAQAGVRPESPLSLMREYFTALRGLLAGRTVTVSGDYVRLSDVALGWPPSPAPHLLMGASGPRSLRLCGELADGVVLAGDVSPAAVVAARTVLAEGRVAAAAAEIVVYLPALADSGVQAVADDVRRSIDVGATTVVLEPSANEPDIASYFRFAAQAFARVPR
jgi:alkanesulfonate monooxygenase SsuD/methylene tetrahydromethanopterin reductase-like flavin-dependent oxidoreductase (luciferase family)